MPVPARITLITRSGCHLCEPARDVVRRVGADTGQGWAELSVDDDPELLARWSDLVPVTLVDGEHHAHWWVDEEALRMALAR